ncbi:MAG: bifunctional 3,4-dihydroxy-2-butanone-4-phosphate synthase/GTP cyclohydrolase II [Bacteroidales bacterium]|nr:bifunctional 3,4-dihydroxy-2-butanone-4-phosphate synthase/GTP cyclohydrolase II [Bacteroidales bacterium]
MEMTQFNTIEEAIEDIRQGKMVIVVDDENRENEGDLVMAADRVTPEAITFMAKQAGGLICSPVDKKRLDELDIDMMVHNSTDKKQTAFTVSVDAADCSTGISAFERAHTIKKLVDHEAGPEDFTKPGHIFPLAAKKYGVLERAGHTEAAADLSELAGYQRAGVICEVMNDDGTMARVPNLMDFAEKFNLKVITIEDLIRYRRAQESIVKRVTETDLPTKHGNFRAIGFESKKTGEHHLAMVKGEIQPDDEVLVRVHSECLTGDALGSLRCDCGDQLHEAMQRVEEAGKGVVVYLRQEGRGIGLINKLKAYSLQDQGFDTVEANHMLGFKADLREYGIGAEILANIGVHKMRLMTNNPLKIKGLKGYNLEVVERLPIEMTCNEKNEYYMSTKMEKMGHMLHVKQFNTHQLKD